MSVSGSSNDTVVRILDGFLFAEAAQLIDSDNEISGEPGAVHLARAGMTELFPLWLRPTAALARDMFTHGVSAIVCCVDRRRLDGSFAGRHYDAQLLVGLPADVDPCAGNGEFHACVTAGPMFRAPLSITVGEVVERDGFLFADMY